MQAIVIHRGRDARVGKRWRDVANPRSRGDSERACGRGNAAVQTMA
jgi:hypothetical protein